MRQVVLILKKQIRETEWEKRLVERLRVQDLDFGGGILIVREGKGGKDLQLLQFQQPLCQGDEFRAAFPVHRFLLVADVLVLIPR